MKKGNDENEVEIVKSAEYDERSFVWHVRSLEETQVVSRDQLPRVATAISARQKREAELEGEKERMREREILFFLWGCSLRPDFQR